MGGTRQFRQLIRPSIMLRIALRLELPMALRPEIAMA